MKNHIKILLVFGLLIIVYLTIIVLSTRDSSNESKKEEQELNKLLGNMHFKGKVIKFSLISRFGKRYTLSCIKLDYTNVDNFYLYKNGYGLAIKNGIATVPGGFFPYNGKETDYIEINMGSTKKEIFRYKDGSIEEFEHIIGAMGLYESDMSMCK